MKRKELSKILVGVCLVLVLALALPLTSACRAPTPTPTPTPPTPTPTPKPPEPPKPIVLKAVHWTTDARMSNFGYWWLRDWLEERSNGEIDFQHKGGNEAIPYKEQFAALQAGVVDIVLAPASFHFATYPFAQLIHLAKLTPEGRLPQEVWDFLQEEYNAIGVRFLGQAKQWQPWHMFLTDVKATRIDDIKGLKIGHPGSTAFGDFIDATGAVQVSLGTTEMYSALERGLVDGIVMGTDMYKLGLHELVKYIVIPPFKTANNTAIFMNLDTWNSLPKHLQDVVMDVTDDMATEGLKRDIQVAQEYWQILMDAGLETTELVPEDAELWVTLYWTKNWEDVKEWDPVKYEIMKELAEIGEGPAGLPY